MTQQTERRMTELLEAYSRLETDVRTLMTRLFSPTCGLCTSCCCRTDICEEAVESAFLSQLINRQGIKSDDLDSRSGWLGLHGCILEYGKPPVCNAYFCDDILARLPDEDARFSTKVLGKLMHHVGMDALNGLHLVHIRNREDFAQLDYDRLMIRMAETQAAYEAITTYMESGRLTTPLREKLQLITTDEPD